MGQLIFYLKLLANEGLAPQLDGCVRCGIEGPLVALDVGEGGVLCVDCRRGRPVSEPALAVLRAILGGGLTDALEVTDPRICGEVDALGVLRVQLPALRVLVDSLYPAPVHERPVAIFEPGPVLCWPHVRLMPNDEGQTSQLDPILALNT